jgi:hypothetical protein
MVNPDLDRRARRRPTAVLARWSCGLPACTFDTWAPAVKAAFFVCQTACLAAQHRGLTMPGPTVLPHFRGTVRKPDAKTAHHLVTGRPAAGHFRVFVMAGLGWVFLAGLLGCGGLTTSSSTGPGNQTVAVSVSPNSASLAPGGTQQFSATVTESSNTAVTWSATGGTVSSSGLYTAGSTVGSYAVTATSVADNSKSAPAAVTVSGAAPPPGTASSITKDGITWTFSQPALVGQFVTGDYYVVGPVTVTAISPAPTTSAPYLNGSVLNLPTANSKSGFDSRLNDGTDQSWWFDATLRSYPPINLKPGDAQVSSISLAQIHSLPEVMRASDMSASPVRTVSVLTVVSSPFSADAFRPSYCDRSQTLYHAGALQRNLLPFLTPPNPSATPTLAQFASWYRRPWIDTDPLPLRRARRVHTQLRPAHRLRRLLRLAAAHAELPCR